MRVLFIVLLLAGCGSGGSSDDNNHGYGFQSDLQGASGLKLRYSSALVATDPDFQALSTLPYYEDAWTKTQACTGMTAPAPFVILVTNGDLGDDIGGRYFSNPSLIVLDAHAFAVRHEMVHYLLDVNTGDPDRAPDHNDHPLFKSCGGFAFGAVTRSL